MNSFNFRSSVCTDRVQSERLLALGLKKETADMHWFNTGTFGWQHCSSETYIEAISHPFKKEWATNGVILPAWSLGRLINLMPQSIHLDSFADTHYYRALLPSKIIYMKYDHTWIWQSDKQNDFDKCVDTVEWLIKEGYFPKEYLCEKDKEYECIGLPKDIEALEGFSIKDNKMLGNEHIYWK